MGAMLLAEDEIEQPIRHIDDAFIAHRVPDFSAGECVFLLIGNPRDACAVVPHDDVAEGDHVSRFHASDLRGASAVVGCDLHPMCATCTVFTGLCCGGVHSLSRLELATSASDYTIPCSVYECEHTSLGVRCAGAVRAANPAGILPRPTP